VRLYSRVQYTTVRLYRRLQYRTVRPAKLK